jgi:plasmid stabilization system protein ParE
MKSIIFRSRAERDLLEIVDYFSDYSPRTAVKVLDDIYRSIDQLAYFPHSGRPIKGQDFRRLVIIKYHFVIGYAVTADAVTIIGIYRYQDREV